MCVEDDSQLNQTQEIPNATLTAERLAGWRGLIAQFSKDSIGFLRGLHRTYGEAVLVGQPPQSCLFTFSSQYTHLVLSNPGLFHSYELEAVPFPFSQSKAIARMTTALALMNGDKHKQQRRLMSPAFHNHRIDAYESEIIALVNRRLENWEIGQERDILADMDALSVLFSLAILIGVDSDAAGLRLGGLFESTMNDLFNPMAFLFPYTIPGFPYRRLLKHAALLESELVALIDERRRQGTSHGDAMSLLIAAEDEDGTKLTQDELIGQTVALFRGGSKTTASALTWTLFFLDQHPRVAMKLHDELTRRLNGAPPSLEDLAHLPYLEYTIKESMRLMPPVIWGIRYSNAEFSLGNRCFPAGQNVMYSAQIAHRNPGIFPQPDRFFPERWETARPTAYEYFPFSAGPRLCLGAGFAMLAMKLTLGVLLQSYYPRLQPGSRIDRVGLIGSLPRGGMRMELTEPGTTTAPKIPRGNIRKFYISEGE